jgi:hypothetical protein
MFHSSYQRAASYWQLVVRSRRKAVVCLPARVIRREVAFLQLLYISYMNDKIGLAVAIYIAGNIGVSLCDTIVEPGRLWQPPPTIRVAA